MGSDAGSDDERPVHRVSVNAFLLGAFQVTNAEYALFLQATNHAAPPSWGVAVFDDPEQPVVAVSWLDAVAYCGWLSSVTGRRFRLPSEAEWECGARGGAEQMLYPWGNDLPESLPGSDTRWLNGPEPVGQGTPNAFGLYDICENVHEWCADWYDAGYYGISPAHDPRGPESGTRRVSRGGSWRHRVKVTRCAARSSIPPEYRYTDYGFRVACEG
jgi:formylglycine-generating enzyme required for sulfatase activity